VLVHDREALAQAFAPQEAEGEIEDDEVAGVPADLSTVEPGGLLALSAVPRPLPLMSRLGYRRTDGETHGTAVRE